MDKRKHEEPSRWDRFMDTVLMTKSFEYEVDLSPEECAERIRGLAKEQNSIWDATSREVYSSAVHDQTSSFEIRAIRHNKGHGSVSAAATGIILGNAGGGKSIVRGKSSLPSSFIMSLIYIIPTLLVIFLVMGALMPSAQLFQSMLSAVVPIAIVASIGIGGVVFLMGSSDSEELCTLIYNAPHK